MILVTPARYGWTMDIRKLLTAAGIGFVVVYDGPGDGCPLTERADKAA